MTAKFPLRRCSSPAVTLFLVLGFCGSLHAQGERTSAEFDLLREAWSQAPADSQATTAAELQAFVEDFLGSEAVQHYLAWSSAPSASEADSILELVEVAADRHGVRWARARPMLETYLLSVRGAVHRGGEVGLSAEPSMGAGEPAGDKSRHSHDVTDVEVHIEPYQPFTVGQSLEVNGSIHNHSKDSYVYLAPSNALLFLPPTLVAAGGWIREMEADFPGRQVRDTVDPQIVVLEPNSTVRVVWRARRDTSELAQAGMGEMLGRLFDLALLESREYMVEGDIWVATDLWAARHPNSLHGWQQVGEASSYPGAILVQWRFLFLLPAIWAGGVLVLAAQLIFGSMQVAPRARQAGKKLGIRFAGAVVLTTLVAVLSLVFGEAPLLPNINMNGLMEAFATGMLIQFLGYRYFEARVSKVLASGGRIAARISGQGRVAGT